MNPRLPFEQTTISVAKSQMEIKEKLYSIGFSRIAELTEADGRKVIIADYGDSNKQVSFQFEGNPQKIMELQPKLDREQAERVAWRVIWHHVKLVHDLIKHGLLDVVDAFAGNLLLTDKAGRPQTMSDFIKIGIEQGKLISESIADKFLLEKAK